MEKTSPLLGLIPEWAEQDAVLIAWPHSGSDWASMLPEIESTYQKLASAILRFEPLIVLLPEGKDIRPLFDKELLPRLHTITLPTNDTWARDYAPLSCYSAEGKYIVDYRFNGWGQKFASNEDNQVARRLYQMGLFAPDCQWLNRQDFVFEGGAVESDGVARLLTTEHCLLEANRNPTLDKQTLSEDICRTMGASELMILTHGAIEGDDTDGHIDTLARFVDANTIAYVAPTDVRSFNYDYLVAMEKEVKMLRRTNGMPYNLIPLPDAGSFFDEEGAAMPATYANFLFVNGGVLVPTYGSATDDEALSLLQKALPERTVVGVDCYHLIRQHGSLHCATMQFPQGFINPSILCNHQ